MIELITIKNEDNQYISELDHNQYPVFTNSIIKIMSFKNLEDAQDFANEYLDELECYEIINLKIHIKLDESTLKTINF
jgi:hypothetical protein